MELRTELSEDICKETLEPNLSIGLGSTGSNATMILEPEETGYYSIMTSDIKNYFCPDNASDTYVLIVEDADIPITEAMHPLCKKQNEDRGSILEQEAIRNEQNRIKKFCGQFTPIIMNYCINESKFRQKLLNKPQLAKTIKEDPWLSEITIKAILLLGKPYGEEWGDTELCDGMKMGCTNGDGDMCLIVGFLIQRGGHCNELPKKSKKYFKKACKMGIKEGCKK